MLYAVGLFIYYSLIVFWDGVSFICVLL